MRLSKISETLGCKLEGDGTVEIFRVVGIEEASPGDLTFLSNPKYYSKLKSTKASAIILGEEVPKPDLNILRSENPYLSFAQAIELFYTLPSPTPGIHPTAQISPLARLGENPSIGPYAIVEKNVLIGDNAVLHPHVVIYPGVKIGHNFLAHCHVSVRENCEIGNNVILQNGVVIGGDGYGFAKTADGSYYKIIQSGRVVIEDNVEVQSNSTIDRAAIGETRISRGAKIDNLVQIGHGSSVGENALLCAQVGLAGSTHIGKNVILTGQVGVAGHCTIGDGAIATAQTGIPSDVEAGKIVSGSPSIDNKLWLKCSAIYRKLPDLYKTLKELEKRVEKLAESEK